MRSIFLCISLLCMYQLTFSQQKTKWYRPTEVAGAATGAASIFQRLPDSLKAQVREPVWNLSLQTAGEFIHFRTSATSLTVRYKTGSNHFDMPHMPSTGVSGLDLYATDVNGDWNWASGRYHFGDTCSYEFTNLVLRRAPSRIADFYLYLPLYNSVRWLEIGVGEAETFSFAEGESKLPIVAYGTSILQGGVASRPGLAWTNILHRELNRPVINLGFSGEGKFEKPLFDFMAQTKAKLYILDCMPNLVSGISERDITARVRYGVSVLQRNNPNTPILFAEHAAGHSPLYMNRAAQNAFHNSSFIIKKIFKELAASGVKNIYLLTDEEIGFDINCTTDGLHPNDIGMLRYAKAYERKIRQFIRE